MNPPPKVVPYPVPFAVDFVPSPGLWSLAKTDLGPPPEGWGLVGWLDRAERRALALELDLAGCLDSGLLA